MEHSYEQEAIDALYSVLGLAKPGLQPCREQCLGTLHTDDFIAVGEDAFHFSRKEYAEIAKNWAMSAIESDGQGPAKIRLIIPGEKVLPQYFSPEEIRDGAMQIFRRHHLPDDTPYRIYRITYFRDQH